ncbi:MAG: hypothetical protein U0W24_25375 [Bacteroidales bacterium]
MKNKGLKLIYSRSDQNIILISYLVFAVLFLSYVIELPYYFSHEGFKNEFDFRKIPFLLLILALPLLNPFIKTAYIKATWNILIIYLLYSSVIYYFFNDARISIVIQNLILILTILVADYIEPSIKIKTFDANKYYILLLLVAFLFFIPFLKYYDQINLGNILFKDVYETRFLFRNIDNKYIGYLESPLSRVLLPVVAIIALNKRNIYVFTIAVIMILYIYLCSATKSLLIGILVVLFFYYGKDFIVKYKIFALLVAGLCLTGIFLSYFFNELYLYDAFVRRVFFIPPKLDNIYHQYFTGNYTYYGHSSLSFGFLPNKYGESLSMFMGENVMKTKGLNANVGILTEGYSALGYPGVFISSLIYLILVVLIKAFKLAPEFFGLTFIYIYVFNSSFLSTIFFSHGFFFLLVFLFLFLNNINIKESGKS